MIPTHITLVPPIEIDDLLVADVEKHLEEVAADDRELLRTSARDGYLPARVARRVRDPRRGHLAVRAAGRRRTPGAARRSSCSTPTTRTSPSRTTSRTRSSTARSTSSRRSSASSTSRTSTSTSTTRTSAGRPTRRFALQGTPTEDAFAPGASCESCVAADPSSTTSCGRRSTTARVKAGQQAGAVTYFAFLSFFPILALAFFVVGWIAKVYPDASDTLTDAINSVLPGLIGTERGPDLAARTSRRPPPPLGIVGVAGAALLRARLALRDARRPGRGLRGAGEGAAELRVRQAPRPDHPDPHRGDPAGLGRGRGLRRRLLRRRFSTGSASARS